MKHVTHCEEYLLNPRPHFRLNISFIPLSVHENVGNWSNNDIIFHLTTISSQYFWLSLAIL